MYKPGCHQFSGCFSKITNNLLHAHLYHCIHSKSQIPIYYIYCLVRMSGDNPVYSCSFDSVLSQWIVSASGAHRLTLTPMPYKHRCVLIVVQYMATQAVVLLGLYALCIASAELQCLVPVCSCVATPIKPVTQNHDLSDLCGCLLWRAGDSQHQGHPRSGN